MRIYPPQHVFEQSDGCNEAATDGQFDRIRRLSAFPWLNHLPKLMYACCTANKGELKTLFIMIMEKSLLSECLDSLESVGDSHSSGESDTSLLMIGAADSIVG